MTSDLHLRSTRNYCVTSRKLDAKESESQEMRLTQEDPGNEVGKIMLEPRGSGNERKRTSYEVEPFSEKAGSAVSQFIRRQKDAATEKQAITPIIQRGRV